MAKDQLQTLDIEYEGQTQVWKAMLSHADSMVLRSAIELRIPDLIHDHGDGQPPSLPLSRLTSLIPSPPSDPVPLLRIMRFLVRNRIFSSHPDPISGEPLFALTPASSALLSSSDRNLSPMVLFLTHPLLFAAWPHFAESIQARQNPYMMAHGMDLLSGTVAANPEFNAVFNGAMGCTAKGMMEAVLEGYGEGEGFKGVGTVADVGGGPGAMVAEIVRLNPGVKGINFDLPFVVERAPVFPGVIHVAGNMFEYIPPADVVFMKTVLHCFGDEECLKVLNNCKKVIPKTGKIIIVDIVLNSEDDSPWGDIRAKFDMLMYANSSTGKERTEEEWRELLKLAGFLHLNFIKIPAIWSIIEAFPE